MRWRERFSEMLKRLLPDTLATTLAGLLKRRMEHAYDRWSATPWAQRMAQYIRNMTPVGQAVTETFLNSLIGAITAAFPQTPVSSFTKDMLRDAVPEFLSRFMNGVRPGNIYERKFHGLLEQLIQHDAEAGAKLLQWFVTLSNEQRQLFVVTMGHLYWEQLLTFVALPDPERESLFEYWQLQYGLAKSTTPNEAWQSAWSTVAQFGKRASLTVIAGAVWYLRWFLALGMFALVTALVLSGIMSLITWITDPGATVWTIYMVSLWGLVLVVALYGAPLLLLAIVFYRAFRSVRLLASIYGELLMAGLIMMAVTLAFAGVSPKLTFLLLFSGAVLACLRWRRGESLATPFLRWTERLFFASFMILIVGRLLFFVAQQLPATAALAHEASQQTNDLLAGLRDQMMDAENRSLSEEEVAAMPRRFDADKNPLVWCYERPVQDVLDQKYICFKRRRGGTETKYGLDLTAITDKMVIEIESRVAARAMKQEEVRRQQQKEAAEKATSEEQARRTAQAEQERLQREEEEHQRQIAQAPPEPAPSPPTSLWPEPIPSPEPVPEDRVLATINTLPMGTALLLTLEEYISNESVRPDYRVEGTFDKPLMLEGQVVLRPGSKANIEVTETGPDSLVLQLARIIPSDRSIAPIELESEPVRFARTNKGWLVPYGVIIGPFGREIRNEKPGRITLSFRLGKQKPKPLELPVGSRITFRTREPFHVIARR